MEPTLKEHLQDAVNRIDKLERRPKDSWDKLSIVLPALIPLSIGIAGYWVSLSIKEAEISSAERLADRQQEVQRISAAVAQAQLISTFIPELTGSNVQKQKLAIKAVLIALPDRGPELVKILSETDPAKEVRSFATTALDSRRQSLVDQLFVEDKYTRLSARKELVSGWLQDAALVPQLISVARKQSENRSGVINVLSVLKSMDPELLQVYSEPLRLFFTEVASNGPQTKDFIGEVEKRMAKASN